MSPDDGLRGWLSLGRDLERIESHWGVLRKHFHHIEKGRLFSLHEEKTILSQLCALVYPISDIIKDSQPLNTWVAGRTLVGMSQLKVGLLTLDRPLAVSCS